MAEPIYSTFQCLGSKQAGFSQYLWRWYSDWAISTGTTATKTAVDIALSPSAECSSHFYRGPKGKEWQWDTT